MSSKSPRIGKILGIVGILCVILYLLVNYLSYEGGPFWRKLLDVEQVQIISILLLFIGGEIIIALGSILTARAKRRAGLGVLAALFGLFGLGWIFLLRPGLYPTLIMSFFGPIGFLIILLLIADKGEESQARRVGMNKVSKGFFLASVAIGLGVGQVCNIIGTLKTRAGDPSGGMETIMIGLIPMLYGAVVMAVLQYKMWAAIQDGSARTTPGKVIGFMFIPLFNFYWMFQVLWGFAKDYNAYIQRHSIKANTLPEGLFLTMCILTFTGFIPVLGLVLVTINLVIGLVVVAKICDAINALPNPAA